VQQHNDIKQSHSIQGTHSMFRLRWIEQFKINQYVISAIQLGFYLIFNQFFSLLFICLDRVFGPSTATEAVYDVAARPVVKGAMEGINGMLLSLI
jgi:hypothetical protein